MGSVKVILWTTSYISFWTHLGFVFWNFSLESCNLLLILYCGFCPVLYPLTWTWFFVSALPSRSIFPWVLTQFPKATEGNVRQLFPETLIFSRTYSSSSSSRFGGGSRELFSSGFRRCDSSVAKAQFLDSPTKCLSSRTQNPLEATGGHSLLVVSPLPLAYDELRGYIF